MFDKNSYQSVYMKEHYDTVATVLPKGEKDTIRAAAMEEGVSVSDLIRRAIGLYLGRDFRLGSTCDVSLENYYTQLTGEELEYAS